MSENIRKYKAPTEWFVDAADLVLTAIVGGEEYGHSIQFTIGAEYAVLSEKQLLDLISVISRRLLGRKGFTATGHTEMKIVLTDGTIIVEEEIE